MGRDKYSEQSRLVFNFYAAGLRLLCAAILCTGVSQAAAIFGAPSGTINSVSGGTTGGSLGGSLISGGAGVSLNGMATLTGATGSNGLILDWTGSGSGTFNTLTQPMDWNFSISLPGSSSSTWTLLIRMNRTTSPIDTTYTGMVGAGGGTVTTSFAAFNTPQGNPFSGGYEVRLEVDSSFSSSTQLMTVNAPSSIDLLPSTPEPGSMWLAAIGFAGLVSTKLLRRRK